MAKLIEKINQIDEMIENLKKELEEDNAKAEATKRRDLRAVRDGIVLDDIERLRALAKAKIRALEDLIAA